MSAEQDQAAGGRVVTPEAGRALAEARERRLKAEAARVAETAQAKELHGRDGLEPVRFGDWEVKGLATDF